jgi:V/A-type H+-transporting ATPase subunit I
MITPMAGVEIAGPLRLFDRTVMAIQEAGSLHIEEIPLLEEQSQEANLRRIRLSEAQARDRQSLEEVLRLLEEAVARLPSAKALAGSPLLAPEYRKWESQPPATLASAARILHSRVRALVRRERNLADDLQALSVYEEVTVALAPLVEGHLLPPELEFVGVVFEKQPHLSATLLEKEMSTLTAGRFRYFQSSLRGERVAALVGFPRERDPEVREFLGRSGISPMALPRYLRGKPFEQALAALEADLSGLRSKQEALAAQSRRFFEENGLQLLAMRDACRDLLARYEAYGKFARTDYAFLVRGWLVTDGQEGLAARLREQAGPAVVLRPVRARSMGHPPVLLDNPRPIGAFEPLLSLLPLPQYGSVDPTKFVATFFPPMFGLMLGDIGYGAILAVGAALLWLLGSRRKRAMGGSSRPAKARLVRRLAVVLGACAFFTIAFGVVFGELFGSLGHELGLRPLWRERFPVGSARLAGAILSYLGLAVGVGALQIVFGLVLGVVNARRFGDRDLAVGNLARIAGIFMLAFFVGRLAGVLPPVFTWLGLGAAAAFLALMAVQTVHHPAHGLMLPIEVLGAVGNILSYARIMAIGMASVVLALLASILARLMDNAVLAVVVVVLVHSLNLVLGTIDPTIQGMRLQYVEFFSKFLLTGGKRFKPFRKIGGEFA